MGVDTVLWGFPLVYILHDLEEIFTVEKWMNINRDEIFKIAEKNRLLKRFAKSADLTTGQFSLAFVILLFLVISSSYLATHRFDMDLFLALLGAMFLHTFTHIGQTVFFRRYTPGVITAISVILPYTLYTFHQLLLWGMVNLLSIVVTAIIGMLFVMPLLLLAHAIGRRFVRF